MVAKLERRCEGIDRKDSERVLGVDPDRGIADGDAGHQTTARVSYACEYRFSSATQNRHFPDKRSSFVASGIVFSKGGLLHERLV